MSGKWTNDLTQLALSEGWVPPPLVGRITDEARDELVSRAASLIEVRKDLDDWTTAEQIIGLVEAAASHVTGDDPLDAPTEKWTEWRVFFRAGEYEGATNWTRDYSEVEGYDNDSPPDWTVQRRTVWASVAAALDAGVSASEGEQ